MAAIILAGGRSARLGQPKTLVVVGGVPLLQRVVEVVASVSAPVFLVTRPDVPLPPLRQVTVVYDEAELQGPLVGLWTGLRHSPDAANLVVAGDHSDLQPALLQALLDRLPGALAAVPRLDGEPQPLCAAYDGGAVEPAGRLISEGVTGVRALLREIRVNWLDAEALRRFDPALRSFADIDDPADLPTGQARSAASD